MRAHRAVRQIIDRYGADAITIECLMLKHRKPCLSFAINNGELLPSGCENHLDATLTMMLGRWLLDRAGFQHNPEFDTSENRYFGAHCTCALKLHGPAGRQPAVCRAAVLPPASQDGGAGRPMDARRADPGGEVPDGQGHAVVLDGQGDRVARLAADRRLRHARADGDRRRRRTSATSTPARTRCCSAATAATPGGSRRSPACTG